MIKEGKWRRVEKAKWGESGKRRKGISDKMGKKRRKGEK